MTSDQITYKIIGCAMQVHSELGTGFQEIIYSRSLAIELSAIGLNYDREKEQPIFYKGIQVGTRRADFIVENTLALELKAQSSLEDLHIIQAKNYLTAYNLDVGLLINFGTGSLQYKKIYPYKK